MRILSLHGLVARSPTVPWTNSAERQAASGHGGLGSAGFTDGRGRLRGDAELPHRCRTWTNSFPVSQAGFSGALRKALDTTRACTETDPGGFVAGGHLSRPRCQAGINWSARRGAGRANVQAESTQREIGPGHSHNTCHPNPKGDGAQFSFLTADEKMGRRHFEAGLRCLQINQETAALRAIPKSRTGRQRNKDVNRRILLACELGPRLAGVGLLLLPTPAK